MIPRSTTGWSTPRDASLATSFKTKRSEYKAWIMRAPCVCVFYLFAATLVAAEPRNGAAGIDRLEREGAALISRGAFKEAAVILEQAAKASEANNDSRTAMRMWMRGGALRLILYNYAQALQNFGHAENLANHVDDPDLLTALRTNLSTLYMQTGDLDSSLREADLAVRTAAPAVQYRTQALLQRALVSVCRGEAERGMAEYQQAVEAADLRADSQALAIAWNQLGWLEMQSGKLAAAEDHFVGAFRLALLFKLPALHQSYRNLAHLRLVQRRYPEALHLCDAALLLVRSHPSPGMPWISHLERARVLEALGRRLEALQDYRVALERARHWRGEVLTGERGNLAVDVRLAGITAGLRDLLIDPRTEGAERDRMLEAFLATEGTRSAGLNATRMEALLLSRKTDDYGDALSSIRKPNGPDDVARGKLESIESQAGLPKMDPVVRTPGDARLQLAQLQRRLTPDECLLSFALGFSRSVMWMVTRQTFDWRLLPPRETISRTVGALARASEAGQAGKALSGWLFADLPSAVRSRRDWIFSVEDALFDVPFSALPATGKPASFLIEQHSIRLIPAATFLHDEATQPVGAKLIAVGDPIYNRADPRLPARRPFIVPHAVAAELPRLAGSAKEIDRIANLWRERGLPAEIITGIAVPTAMEAAASNRVRVLHFAAHVQTPNTSRETPSQTLGDTWLRRPGEVELALGLDSRGKPNYLRTTEIASLKLPGALVVLNGCNSGGGPALPGAGLMGLTRAWMAAGAAGVIATSWPTPDDNGAFFDSFYRDYLNRVERGAPSPSRALQAAQLAAIRSGTWRAQPQFWAAYFLMGKE